MRRFAWGLMSALALFIAAYAIALLFVPAMRAPFLRDRFATIPLAAYLHLAGSGIALAIGPFQLNARLRNRFLSVHRWMGRTYVICVLLGGMAALALATMSQAGLPTHVGFGLLAVLWLFATGNAYRYIRAGDQVSHRRWMIRSYALGIRDGDAPHLSPAESDRGPSVRSRLSDHLVAVLGAESHRCRVARSARPFGRVDSGAHFGQGRMIPPSV